MKLIEIERFRNILKKIRDPHHEKYKSFEHWFKWQVYGSDLEFITDFHSHKHIKQNIYDDFLGGASMQGSMSPKLSPMMSPRKMMMDSIYHSSLPLRSIPSDRSHPY